MCVGFEVGDWEGWMDFAWKGTTKSDDDDNDEAGDCNAHVIVCVGEKRRDREGGNGECELNSLSGEFWQS